ITGRFFVFTWPGLDHIHTIPLPATFEAFLAKYDAKKRYNLRRQLRLLRERTRGSLEFRRITAPGDVPLFLDAEAALTGDGSSSRYSESDGLEAMELDRLRDQAARGLLRSYLLLDGDRPIASILGMQRGDIYFIGKT